MTSRFRSILKIVAINLGLLFLFLLAAELIFGGWVRGPGWGTLVVPKNFTRRFDTDRLYSGGMITYRRDKHGLRGQYDDPSKINILAIGGSTTNEIFVDEGATWTDVLAKKFAEAGQAVTVVNAGVDGQSTVGNLKNFELWFPKIPGLKTRYILAYLGINDMAVIEAGQARTKQDKLVQPHNASKQFMINNSILYATFRNVRGMIRARDAKLVHGGQDFSGTDWAPAEIDFDAVALRYRSGLDAYERRLRDLAAQIRAVDAEPIFVTQNSGDYRLRDGQVYGAIQDDGSVDPGRYPLLQLVNRRTMAVCRELQAICVDLSDDPKFTAGDHYDGLHTTPQGSAKIGQAIFKRLNGRIALR